MDIYSAEFAESSFLDDSRDFPSMFLASFLASQKVRGCHVVSEKSTFDDFLRTCTVSIGGRYRGDILLDTTSST